MSPVLISATVSYYGHKYKKQQGQILKTKDTWFSVSLHEMYGQNMLLWDWTDFCILLRHQQNYINKLIVTRETSWVVICYSVCLCMKYKAWGKGRQGQRQTGTISMELSSNNIANLLFSHWNGYLGWILLFLPSVSKIIISWWSSMLELMLGSFTITPWIPNICFRCIISRIKRHHYIQWAMQCYIEKVSGFPNFPGSLPLHLMHLCERRQALDCNRRPGAREHGDDVGRLLWVRAYIYQCCFIQRRLVFYFKCGHFAEFLFKHCSTATLRAGSLQWRFQATHNYLRPSVLRKFKWVWQLY